MIPKFFSRGATLILLVTSMKLLRHGFSGATRMFLNFFFAEVLFTCDFPGLSETFPVDYFFVSILLSKAIFFYSYLDFISNVCISYFWDLFGGLEYDLRRVS